MGIKHTLSEETSGEFLGDIIQGLSSNKTIILGSDCMTHSALEEHLKTS